MLIKKTMENKYKLTASYFSKAEINESLSPNSMYPKPLSFPLLSSLGRRTLVT